MIRATDIAVSFSPNTLQGSRSLGYGQVNILGIIISYTVYPSNFGLGFMVSYPSKPSIKNGVHELDAAGKPKYFKEVYIQNIELRNMIDIAVQNAMANKGVFVGQSAQMAQQAGYNVQQAPVASSVPHPSVAFSQPAQTTQFNAPPVQTTQPMQNSFQNPQQTAPLQSVYNTQPASLTPSTNTTPVTPQGVSSMVLDDELPF